MKRFRRRLFGTLIAGLVAGSVVPMPARADAGADYRQLCASCHGSSGKGDGDAARAMPVPLPDFSAASFQAARADADLEKAIREGGSFMQPYSRALDDARIQALVRHIRQFAPD